MFPGSTAGENRDLSLRRARIAALLWGGFLFVLTSWPKPPVVEAGGFPLDKLTHFLLYGVEAFLLDRAIGWPSRGFFWSRVLTIVGVMALWGSLDEAHQEWIPGRRMDAADLAADVAGAAAGAVLAGATGKKPVSRKDPSPRSGRPNRSPTATFSRTRPFRRPRRSGSAD